MNATFPGFIRSSTAMSTDQVRKIEVAWHALLNRPEARVLTAMEERELLIELIDDRKRIIACLTRITDQDWSAPGRATEFQQRVRELANSVLPLDQATAPAVPLARRYQEIRTKLAMANVRLVAHVAKRYYGRGIPPGDLIHEGVCGLISAIDRFDLDNDTRLATYAIWWIRQGIQRAIANGAYPVRLNPRQLHLLARARGAPDEAGNPTVCLTRARVDPPGRAGSQTLERLLMATRPTLSLDAPRGWNGSRSLVEYFQAREEDDPPPEDIGECVGDMIKILNPREQFVLKLRFGLAGATPHTLVQVSRALGVSKERIRQIQARALSKLRNSPVARSHLKLTQTATAS
jgi:RNA polymerase primary sigma factor